MSETLQSDSTEHSQTSKSPQRRKILLGLPLFLFMLAFEALSGSSSSFYQSDTPGIYWFLLYHLKIIGALNLVASCLLILGILTAFLRMTCCKVDRLSVVDLVLFPLLVLALLTLLGPMFPLLGTTHLDTQVATNHVYYLAEHRDLSRLIGTDCFSSMQDCSHLEDARFEYDVSYVVFECGRFGLWCHRIYRSEDQGDPPDNDDPLGGVLKFDRATDELYLQEGDRVFFTYQVSP